MRRFPGAVGMAVIERKFDDSKCKKRGEILTRKEEASLWRALVHFRLERIESRRGTRRLLWSFIGFRIEIDI